MAKLVLIVDDDPTQRRILEETIKRLGYETKTAQGGEQALQILDGPDGAAIALVLLDLVMPGMDGVETLDRLRELRPDLPVAICSGYDESQVAPRFAGRKVQGFVKKPFTAQRILAAAAALAGD